MRRKRYQPDPATATQLRRNGGKTHARLTGCEQQVAVDDYFERLRVSGVIPEPDALTPMQEWL
jgi:hypothetical protein